MAHGEGRFVPREPAVLDRLREADQIALRYTDADGNPATGYPVNPNGSTDDIAGLCDPTGRILGLMPHPERFTDITHHPQWTRGLVTHAHGRRFFDNARAYFS
jgi:phosphoribosylformylglycinamidine synthase